MLRNNFNLQIQGLISPLLLSLVFYIKGKTCYVFIMVSLINFYVLLFLSHHRNCFYHTIKSRLQELHFHLTSPAGVRPILMCNIHWCGAGTLGTASMATQIYSLYKLMEEFPPLFSLFNVLLISSALGILPIVRTPGCALERSIVLSANPCPGYI